MYRQNERRRDRTIQMERLTDRQADGWLDREKDREKDETYTDRQTDRFRLCHCSNYNSY